MGNDEISKRQQMIEVHRDFLDELGAMDVPSYVAKLKANINDENQFADLLCEGYVAMVNLCYGFKVLMQDSPDLLIKLKDQVFYSEVKHFRRKSQDGREEEKMRQAVSQGRLTEYGRTERSADEII